MRFLYLGVLGFCVLGTLPLELVLRARVYARPLRWVLALAPMAAVFLVWDLWAFDRGHWYYSSTKTVGVSLLGLPLEEVLFFLVVPTAAILTFEAVRAVRGWTVGDEPADYVPGSFDGDGP